MYISKGRVVTKIVGAAEFKAKCLKLIDEMQRDGEPVTITKRGKPVATLSVAKPDKPRLASILGALAHPAYRFDDPFSPAVDPDEWDANR
jgi:prevent-host-death family protein